MKHILSIFKDSTGTFEGQEPGEEVVLLVRRHPFAIYMRIALFAVACIVPLFIVASSFEELSSRGLGSITIFVSTLWLLTFWYAIFYALTMYSLNVLIVTNHRVIDNDQFGLFNRKVSELHISRIQDISVHTHGMLETFLRFGEIDVQSAGVEKQFTFEQIPNPEHVKNVITKIARGHQNGVHTHHLEQVPAPSTE